MDKKIQGAQGAQTNSGDSRPDCFGTLDKVFPMTDRGLRETPDECMYYCPCKTACLRSAMGGAQGVPVQEELIERSEQAGMIGFFGRWSRKKLLSKRVV
ncbi:MAG: hypothetical protein RBQ72_08015 [Desulfobacterium sp.]|jgi:hypothetical protein|nr:hypothetical protein [Desulfobacterium sp.]